jgi:hypothetical protein
MPQATDRPITFPSRRAFLTAAPAAAAAALAAGSAVNVLAAASPLSGLAPAVAPPEADPIYGVIAEHRAAWTRYNEARDLSKKLRAKEEEETDLWEPDEFVLGEHREIVAETILKTDSEYHGRWARTGKMVPIVARNLSEIETNVPKELSKSERRVWVRSKKAEWERTRKARSAARDKLPSADSYDKWNEAGHVLNSVTKRLVRAKLTTPAGAAAALKHWAGFTLESDDEWFIDPDRTAKFMTNVAKALAKIEGAQS